MSVIEIPVPYLFITSCINTPPEWMYEIENSGILTEPEALKFDEVVIPDKRSITIVFSYPLSKEFVFNYEKIEYGKEMDGYTRKDLITVIGKIYEYMYNEEEITSNEKVISTEEQNTILYRNQTDGRFGIWGYNIDDLILARVVYNTDEKRVYLNIDS